jgi:hypothetical protein
VLLALVLVAAGGAWWVLRGRQPGAGSAAQPVVRDGELVDARTGDPWVPRCVTWSSFEYACAQGWGYSALDSLGPDAEAEQAATIASWGADTVRLPLNQDCWLGTRGAPVSDDFDSRTPTGYRSAVGDFVDALGAEGIVVVLDLQSRKRIGSPEFGDLAMPDSESLAFWASVATEYADDPSVLFEAFGSPTSRQDARGRPVLDLTWRCWRDGGCAVPVEDDRTEVDQDGATYDAQGMADVVATIRRAGAEQPILLSGLEAGNDLERWAELAPTDDQLVAAFHVDDRAACGERCWDRVVAPLADRFPVLTTDVHATDPLDGWVADYLRWADAHGIGSLLGVWAEHPGDPQALVSDLAGRPTAWGELARAWLRRGTEGL